MASSRRSRRTGTSSRMAVIDRNVLRIAAYELLVLRRHSAEGRDQRSDRARQALLDPELGRVHQRHPRQDQGQVRRSLRAPRSRRARRARPAREPSLHRSLRRPPRTDAPPSPLMGFLDKLKSKLTRTREKLSDGITGLFKGRAADRPSRCSTSSKSCCSRPISVLLASELVERARPRSIGAARSRAKRTCAPSLRATLRRAARRRRRRARARRDVADRDPRRAA